VKKEKTCEPGCTKACCAKKEKTCEPGCTKACCTDSISDQVNTELDTADIKD